ncbi:VOC family protein [Kineosporia sp. A_224]|uniref:VOC family protein n=1 Tax=Kineosporia sp. A_224 TaxID=1962180 RepID=UPI000B4B5F21|nr:VOC family protein [Kineosporia sp. A_224]
MPRLLDAEELTRQLAELPGVARGRWGSLVLAAQAPTFADAVRLVALVADEAEQMDHHPDVDLRWRTVSFTFSTHSAGGVTQYDVELAHRALAAAKAVGAQTLPPPERLEVALDVVDPGAVRPFWKAVLGYREHVAPGDAGAGAELHDPRSQTALWFQRMDPARAGRGRFHLDVYVPADACRARVDAALAAGGRLVSDAHAPSWWVLADAEGNEACVCST